MDPVECGEWCPRQELIESEQGSLLRRLFLTIHFLQAENVSVDALQLRTHHTYALREDWILSGNVVEVFEVVGREANFRHCRLLT
jgi:hypothetical protein